MRRIANHMGAVSDPDEALVLQTDGTAHPADIWFSPLGFSLLSLQARLQHLHGPDWMGVGEGCCNIALSSRY